MVFSSFMLQGFRTFALTIFSLENKDLRCYAIRINYIFLYRKNEVIVTREYSDYIEDILTAIEKAETFIKDLSYEDFINDEKTVYAVIRALEIIGETTKKIPDDIRLNNTEIPWKDMAGMRDVLIHNYISVDVETVWLTVKDKIPQIKPLIEGLAKDKK